MVRRARTSRNGEEQKSKRPREILNRIEPKTEGQRELLRAIGENEVTICDGPAGSGKTLLTFHCAFRYYLINPSVRRIVLVRPTILAGDDHDIGSLPGGVNDKMSPFIAPFVRDSAPLILNGENFRSNLSHLDRGAPDPLTSLTHRFDIEIVPLQFMRGRTFSHCFVVLDEAQNCTMNDLKLCISRLGDEAKMVIEGDSTQADRDDSALAEFQERMRGAPGVGIVNMAAADIVRNPLIAEWLRRLE